MAEANGISMRGRLAKAFGGDVDAIRKEIQSSTRAELMERYELSYGGGVGFQCKLYGVSAMRGSKRLRPCKGCGKGEPEVSIRKPRRICTRCESVRKGRSCACIRCGADIFGNASKARRCDACRGAVKELLKRQRKRGIEAWQRAVALGWHEGDYLSWAHGNCPLKRWVDEQVRVVTIKPLPRKRVPTMNSAELFRFRYRTDPVFNLKQRMRASAKKHRRFGCINTRLRSGVKSVFEFLGYTAHDLARHLERQFARGMTWEAFMRGEIHIDHVRPLKAFDLNDEEQVREAWALPNLQPLWARDNLAKGARVGALV